MDSIKHVCSNEFEIKLLVRYQEKGWGERFETFNESDHICLLFNDGHNPSFVVTLTDSTHVDKLQIYASGEGENFEPDDECLEGRPVLFRELTEHELLLIEKHLGYFDVDINAEIDDNVLGFIGVINPADVLQKMLRKTKINKLK